MNKSNAIRTGVRLAVTGVAAGVVAYVPEWMQDKVYDAIAKGAAVMGAAAAVDLVWAGTEAVMASSLEVNGEQIKAANVNVTAPSADVSITTHSEVAADAVTTPPTTESVKQQVHASSGHKTASANAKQ